MPPIITLSITSPTLKTTKKEYDYYVSYVNLLYKELSYQIQGAIIEVRKIYGPGHKESIYQKALEEEFVIGGVSFEREVSIKIISPKTGKTIGIYRPDFVVDKKIILEIKALDMVPRKLIDQLFDYLKNSNYELGYFVNFCGSKLLMKRIIYTNDRKFFSGS